MCDLSIAVLVVRGSMTDSANDSTVQSAVALLTYYGFEPGEASGEQLMDRWLRTYPTRWVRLALIEALYQGRYKAVSVEQILAFWQRRGQPLYHFNHEFERLVCNNFPRDLRAQAAPRGTIRRVYPRRPTPLPQLQASAMPDPETELSGPLITDATADTTADAPANITADITVAPPPSPAPLPALMPGVPAGAAQEPETGVSAEKLQSLKSETVPPSLAEAEVTQATTPAIAPGTVESEPAPEVSSWPPVRSGPQEAAPTEENAYHDPIHQFTLDAVAADFCAKLSAIALAERNRLSPPPKELGL